MTGKELLNMLQDLSSEELELPVKSFDDVDFYNIQDVLVDENHNCVKLLKHGFGSLQHAKKYGTKEDVDWFKKCGKAER